MKKIILGLKLGMSQVIRENGEVIPVTLVQVVDNMVLDVKEINTDQWAMVLGVGKVKEKKLTKPMKGQFDKYKKGYFKYIKNYNLESTDGIELGSSLTTEWFDENESVNVRGKRRS